MMFKISNIISLPVISIYESEFQGIIYNMIFDKKLKKCKFICLLNEKENIKKIFKATDIYKICETCVFIKNASVIELESNYNITQEPCVSLLNQDIYDTETGQLLGKSMDIEIDAKYNITSIILNTEKILPISNIFNFGKNIILTKNHNININKFKPIEKLPLSHNNCKTIVNILPHSNQNTTNIPKPLKQSSDKLVTDFRFLIGRTLSKDIIAVNGEIIAKKGTTLTKENVKRASSYGKLVEIARYSNKKNIQ